MAHTTCAVDDCDRPVRTKGWCHSHYHRWNRYGDPLAYPQDRLTAFLKRVEKTPTCWLWLGFCGPDGYGRFSVQRKNVYAHRWSYTHHVGPIPDGLELDHLCRVKWCVNPEHLEPVTGAENMRRRDEALRQERLGPVYNHDHGYVTQQ